MDNYLHDKVMHMARFHPNDESIYGCVPIISAIRHNWLDIIQLLVEHEKVNIHINEVYWCAAFDDAITTATLTYMLTHGLDVNHPFPISKWPIHHQTLLQSRCCRLPPQPHNLDYIRVLLQHGADPNMQAAKETPAPIDCAIIAKNMPLLHLLMAHGARATKYSFKYALGFHNLDVCCLMARQTAPIFDTNQIINWLECIYRIERDHPMDPRYAQLIHKELELLYCYAPGFRIPANYRVPYEDMFLSEGQSTETGTLRYY
jgi:hypothetical protein